MDFESSLLTEESDWVRINFLISKFKLRTDYQPFDKTSDKPALPLRAMGFFAKNKPFGNLGPFDYYFDSIELAE